MCPLTGQRLNPASSGWFIWWPICDSLYLKSPRCEETNKIHSFIHCDSLCQCICDQWQWRDDRLPQYLRILMSISGSKYFEATSFYVEFVIEYKCKFFEESMFDANFAKASVFKNLSAITYGVLSKLLKWYTVHSAACKIQNTPLVLASLRQQGYGRMLI